MTDPLDRLVESSMTRDKITALTRDVDVLAKQMDETNERLATHRAIRNLDRTIQTATTLLVTGACVIVCALQVLDWFGYLVLIAWQVATLLWVRPFGRKS